MDEIRLNDILHMSEEALKDVRIRMNLSNNAFNAIELYHQNPEKLLIGNFHNGADRYDEKEGKDVSGKIWFKEGQIVIGLAQIKGDDWLLIDISRITRSYNKKWDGKTVAQINTFYEHEALKEYEKFFGRLIVSFHKANAYVIMTGENIDKFSVKELLPETLDDDAFPGYDRVNISWKELKRFIEKESWKTALKNQKGVYLITDCKTGKRYVGSAYGENMLLGRWQDYAKDGNGGNKELKKLDFEYIKENFRYSILEIFKSTISDEDIIQRESWWKEVLLSRNEQFGYNDN